MKFNYSLEKLRSAFVIAFTIILVYCIFGMLLSKNRSSGKELAPAVAHKSVRREINSGDSEKNILKILSDCPREVWLLHNTSLLDRLSILNRVISMARNMLLLIDDRKELTWPKKAEVIYTSPTSYLREFHSKFASFVISVYLQYLGPVVNYQRNTSTSQVAMARNNFLVTEYYEWYGTPSLCQLLRTDYYQLLWTNICVANINKTNVSANASTYNETSQLLKPTYISYQMHGGLDTPYVTFIHIILEGAVTNSGEVFAKEFKMVPVTSCGVDLQNLPPAFDERKLYDEIFVISQHWGEAYFHKMMEDMPRLAPFLPFLRQNPNIRIHMRSRDLHTDYLFRALGLDPNRIITDKVHGKLVYLPRSTDCGRLLISEGQILSREYRTHIDNNITGDKTWNSIVLIKRSGARHLNQQTQIETVIQNAATTYDLRYELFPDNPSPSVEETMLMFYRARVIVAPHGAGLSNMLFSRPGTAVIEVICNPPNICYLEASHYLGHRYFGVPSREGCDTGITIDPQDIDSVLEQVFINLKLKNL